MHALKADVTVEPPSPGMPALRSDCALFSIVNHSSHRGSLRGRLNVKRAAVKEELQKGSTGALGSIIKQHASAVLVTECERTSPGHCIHFHNLQQYPQLKPNLRRSDHLGRWPPGFRCRECSRNSRRAIVWRVLSVWFDRVDNCPRETRHQQKLGFGDSFCAISTRCQHGVTCVCMHCSPGDVWRSSCRRGSHEGECCD